MLVLRNDHDRPLLNHLGGDEAVEVADDDTTGFGLEFERHDFSSLLRLAVHQSMCITSPVTIYAAMSRMKT